MKQEDKQLLLQDLCARLPYGVKGRVNGRIVTLDGVNTTDSVVEHDKYFSTDIDKFVPYLFPMKSMTEEQTLSIRDYLQSIEGRLLGSRGRWTYYLDYLNKLHIDHRGLIEKGLAIDATGLNIYNKKEEKQ